MKETQIKFNSYIFWTHEDWTVAAAFCLAETNRKRELKEKQIEFKFYLLNSISKHS